jgi:hypothetical protein
MIAMTAAEEAIYCLDSAIGFLDGIYVDDPFSAIAVELEEARDHLARLAEALTVVLGGDDLPPALSLRLHNLRPRS